MLTRRHFLCTSGCACLVACGGGSPPPVFGTASDDGEFGSLLNAAEFAAAPQAVELAALAGLPLAARDPSLPARHLLENIPPVSMQGTAPPPPQNYGSPGSCEAQSFGYCLGSYTAARFADGTIRWPLDAAHPQNLVSAAWLYLRQLEKQYGCSFPDPAHACKLSGTLAVPYLEQLVSLGAPNAQAIPYDPPTPPPITQTTLRDYLYTVVTNVSYSNQFLIGSYRALPPISTAAKSTLLPQMKGLIAGGHAIAFSGHVPIRNYVWPNLTLFDCVYYIDKQSPVPVLKGGHGQTIVGYDDTIGDPNDPGAFLVQNSFGAAWPTVSYVGCPNQSLLPGRIWYAYSSFFEAQKFAAIAYSVKNGPPSGTPLNTTNQQAPTATIGASKRFVRADGSGLLIFVNEFGAPVRLGQLTLQPPSGNPIVTVYNASISFGYTTFVATAPFAAGPYMLTLAASTPGAGNITYTGTIAVA